MCRRNDFQHSHGEKLMNRFFTNYFLTHWTNVFFGAQLDIRGLVRLAKKVNAGLDLVPWEDWTTVKLNNVPLGSVLPDMGKKSDGTNWDPFAPGMNDPALFDRVHGAIDLALDRAAAAQMKYVIVFSGMATLESRSAQWQRIVRGYIEVKNGQKESLIQKAERLKIVLMMEMLNSVGDPKTWQGHPGILANNYQEMVESCVLPIGSAWFRTAFDAYHVAMMRSDPVKMVELYPKVIGYVHLAGIVMNGIDTYAPTNRGPLNAVDQIIDIPGLMQTLAQHVPPTTPILLEHLPHADNYVDVADDIEASIALCESWRK
ncbi:TIM barrel protein [Candidatus Peregrinibacteria bacterium]|nr:TIM barrel protein [Candidatus Peregrinibacteria bacterium]